MQVSWEPAVRRRVRADTLDGLSLGALRAQVEEEVGAPIATREERDAFRELVTRVVMEVREAAAGAPAGAEEQASGSSDDDDDGDGDGDGGDAESESESESEKKRVSKPKKAPKADANGSSGSRGGGKRVPLPDALSSFLGGLKDSNYFELTKLVNAYVKEHDLRDKSDGRYINGDERLAAVFRCRRFHMFHLGRLLKEVLEGRLTAETPIAASSDEVLPASANGAASAAPKKRSAPASAASSSGAPRASSPIRRKAAVEASKKSRKALSDQALSAAADDDSIGSLSKKKAGAKKAPGKKNLRIYPPALQTISGGMTEGTSFEAIKFIHEHIKKNSLQDPVNRKFVRADDLLQSLLRRPRFTYFQMSSLLSKVLVPVDQE